MVSKGDYLQLFSASFSSNYIIQHPLYGFIQSQLFMVHSGGGGGGGGVFHEKKRIQSCLNREGLGFVEIFQKNPRYIFGFG